MIHSAILDRALEVAWLDLALELGRDGERDARERLELALRDRLPAAESRKKTVRALWRTWLEPPEPAREMIAWARARSPEISDSRLLHIGALIATHPFFGDICAAIGRELAQSGSIRVTAVRQRLRERWAARQSVDVAVRAAARTLRSFGLLSAGPQGRTAELVARLEVPEELSGWLSHALLIARAVDEIDLEAARSAPEFFMLVIGLTAPRSYDGVEVVLEGGRRGVLRLTRMRQPDPHPEQLVLVGEQPVQRPPTRQRLRRAL